MNRRTAIMILILLLATLAATACQPTYGNPCRKVDPDLGVNYLGGDPGTWYGADGNRIGFADAEDSPIYTTAECAMRPRPTLPTNLA